MQRAVVIGGSVAGLMAAKTLSPFFQEVIVLEKDTLNNDNGLHKGVGQGPHSHVLLPSGIELLEQLFGTPTLNLREYGIYPADAADELKCRTLQGYHSLYTLGIYVRTDLPGINQLKPNIVGKPSYGSVRLPTSLCTDSELHDNQHHSPPEYRRFSELQ